jgi:hypothetical protein
MSKIVSQALALSILFAAMPFAASAQEAAAVLQPVAEALRVADVDRLRLVAAGSGYERGQDERAPPTSTQGSAGAAAGRADAADSSSQMDVPPPPPPVRSQFRIVGHVAELDLAAESLRIEERRAASAAPGAEQRAPATLTIDADSDWAERHRYWLMPHAFVAGALAGNATLGNETVAGVDYRVVSITVEGDHEVRGYIDEQGRLVRIRTEVVDGGDTTDVVESFFDWTEQGELTFPSTLIRKENDQLAEVLVVQEIDAG